MEKCFDALWAQECINTLYEYGLDNDKLVLIYEETKYAQIAIKTSIGITERVNITNLIMQGTVFGSLICTAVMDKLARIFYNDSQLFYKYKGTVDVPVLGMVDDVLNVASCSEQVVLSNCTINSFIEHNKLKLAAKKCSRVHVGKKIDSCYDIKVHEEKMKDSLSEKYLGDYFSSDGKIDNTIHDRILRAYSYLSEIRALLTDMPFGKRRLQIGLMLRDAMFVNGVLFNSEAWHSTHSKHLDELELIDRSVMRFILGAHSKTPSETLYLETASLPLRYIIMIRRIMYFQTIVTRDDQELIKRVYDAQKEDPVKGDWINLLKEDFKYIGQDLNEEEAKSTGRTEYKKVIKSKVREKVFIDLNLIKETHSKVQNIQYETFETQEYMKNNNLTNNEVSLLFALRTRTMRSVKNNFGLNLNCSLGCPTPENQEHWLLCQETTSNKNTSIKYSDIFGSITEQINIVKLFSQLEEERMELGLRAAPSSPVA